MPYSFTLIVKRYDRQNCTLDDMRVIYSDKTCLIAKNSKFGDLYVHKTGKIIKGKFVKNAGSIKYPILIAEKEVHIRFENFPTEPNIITDQYRKQDIISIVDISCTMSADKTPLENEIQPSCLGAVMRSCIHCGNKDQSKFEVWEELDYNDGADEPHTGGNYLINVEYGTCLVCGENL